MKMYLQHVYGWWHCVRCVKRLCFSTAELYHKPWLPWSREPHRGQAQFGPLDSPMLAEAWKSQCSHPPRHCCLLNLCHTTHTQYISAVLNHYSWPPLLVEANQWTTNTFLSCVNDKNGIGMGHWVTSLQCLIWSINCFESRNKRPDLHSSERR